MAYKVVPPPTIPAAYAGMQGQTAAVMVWADPGTLIDWPEIRLDVAGAVQNKLVQAQKAKAKELAGLGFPHAPAAVVRFQDNHPELDAAPLQAVAPKLGVSRVIYVELERFQTRSDTSVELFRGSASATVKVVEVAGGAAKIAFEEAGVSAVFPPNAREEGTTAGDDYVFYRGTLDELTSMIAKRFVPYQEEQ